jgi:CRISPR-associated protein Csd2
VCILSLRNKIDFAVIFTAENANPNGDPLNGNRPRENFDGYGEMSDVCIKRKIRNRLMDMGEKIFVQSDEKNNDGFKSLKDRADSIMSLKNEKNPDNFAKIAAAEWIDVRAFGQVFAFKGDDLSVGIRGPVSIQTAVSVMPVDIESIQITKSVNSVTGEKKSSDTLGMKHVIGFGVYVFYGAINCQLAEKTGFTDEDAEKIKKALITLFENDASSARPEGSMEVKYVYWWKHDSPAGRYSSAKVHRSLRVEPVCANPKSFDDFIIKLTELGGLVPEIYEGM